MTLFFLTILNLHKTCLFYKRYVLGYVFFFTIFAIWKQNGQLLFFCGALGKLRACDDHLRDGFFNGLQKLRVLVMDID
jgi:hypothetical protein